MKASFPLLQWFSSIVEHPISGFEKYYKQQFKTITTTICKKIAMTQCKSDPSLLSKMF